MAGGLLQGRENGRKTSARLGEWQKNFHNGRLQGASPLRSNLRPSTSSGWSMYFCTTHLLPAQAQGGGTASTRQRVSKDVRVWE